MILNMIFSERYKLALRRRSQCTRDRLMRIGAFERFRIIGKVVRAGG